MNTRYIPRQNAHEIIASVFVNSFSGFIENNLRIASVNIINIFIMGLDYLIRKAHKDASESEIALLKTPEYRLYLKECYLYKEVWRRRCLMWR